MKEKNENIIYSAFHIIFKFEFYFELWIQFS
jgi:hypothetical protein